MAKVIQVIESETLRGNGSTTIMRGVKQYWTLDGDLLAEVDPCAKLVVEDTAEHVRKRYVAE